MKKFLLFVLMLALLLTGCGSNDVIKVGTIKYLNLTEDELDKILVNNDKLPAGKRKHIFFENLNTMTSALQAGQIDEMSIYRCVASYLLARNPEVQWDISNTIVTDFFCCALREDDVALKKEFDAAILSMTADGKLAELVKIYINKTIRTEDILAAVEMPTFDDADTIRVGVTGDLPLLDYIRADGMPAGFNTAVLAEISRRIEKNFVLVQVDSGARAIALTSKEVDVIFWALSPDNTSIVPQNFDAPDGMILTVPYFSDSIVHISIKK